MRYCVIYTKQRQELVVDLIKDDVSYTTLFNSMFHCRKQSVVTTRASAIMNDLIKANDPQHGIVQDGAEGAKGDNLGQKHFLITLYY